MSIVNITNIQVLDNPSKFSNPFQFEITFECISALKEDLEWKVIYVGSAEDEKHDQVLDAIMVGPVPVGVNKFVFQCDPPNVEKIPSTDIAGVTVVMLTCSYKEKEFVRVGYYVNNDYVEEELRENPPDVVDINLLFRNILAEKPRVTRFPIPWDGPDTTEEEETAGAATEGTSADQGSTSAAIASGSSSSAMQVEDVGADDDVVAWDDMDEEEEEEEEEDDFEEEDLLDDEEDMMGEGEEEEAAEVANPEATMSAADCVPSSSSANTAATTPAILSLPATTGTTETMMKESVKTTSSVTSTGENNMELCA